MEKQVSYYSKLSQEEFLFEAWKVVNEERYKKISTALFHN